MAADRISWRACVLFFGVHVATVIGVAGSGIDARGLGLAAALYAVRMFALSAGAHRYFSHRAFETSRPVQLVLAVIATASSQMGPGWWAAHHRVHHRHADGARDPHLRARGFWWAHAGWFLVETYDATDWAQIPDLARVPELRWLDRHHFVPAIALIAILAAAGGAHAVLWGYGVSTIALWHATFLLTSYVHGDGAQRYTTGDRSRNHPIVALLTFGEGWHNNHHYYPGAARCGFAWWELDVTYAVLRALAAVGVVWNLRAPPARALAAV